MGVGGGGEDLAMSNRKPTPGIFVRHQPACASSGGGRCNCAPQFQANVWDAKNAKRRRKTFDTLTGAKQWRTAALHDVRRGKLAESRPSTSVEEVCTAWLEAAHAGIVRSRSGDAYSSGTLRAYEKHLRLRVYPSLGSAPFYRVRRVDLQDLVDRHLAAGVAPATIQPMLGALGAVYARALQRDEIEVSPSANVRLPSVRNGRTRFATPKEAAALLAATPDRDRPIWAAAMYAGLRRGELQALRWQDVDLAGGTLLVARGWNREGPTTTKNRGRRRVPIIPDLREHFAAQRLRQEPGVDLVFGLAQHRPFDADRLLKRADAAWEGAGLERLTLHDCRHTFASLLIDAGANAKALSVTMGHSSISITIDRYGHLMPGAEAELGALLHDYLRASA